MTGASIGIVGTFVGTAVGILFCWNIDTIKRAIESLSGQSYLPLRSIFFPIYQRN